MRCVLYLRMSTDRQESSISQQRESVMKHAAKHGHDIVGEYIDEGISGDKTSKRLDFQRMIRDAGGGSFDRILCFDQDRFGRFDMLEAGAWIMPLRKASVTLETIAQGVIDWDDFAGRLTYAVAQEGKHQFLRDISRNTIRGLTAKAKACNGFFGGPTPYGYTRSTVFTGKTRVSTLAIDKPTAKVVLRIFKEYACAGGSCRQVVESLNRDGIKPARGGRWGRNAINRILTNRTYAGDYVWGRRVSGRYNGRVGDEIVSRRPGQARMIVDPIVHVDVLPAIIDRKLFANVQRLLVERQTETRARGSIRALSGLLVCGKCGKPMHADTGGFVCSSSANLVQGKRCSRRRVNEPLLIDALAGGLQKHLLAPAAMAAIKARLEKRLVDEAKQFTTSGNEALQREIDALDRELSEGIARIPLLPKSLVPDMAKALDRLRANRDGLKRERASALEIRDSSGQAGRDRVAAAIAVVYGLKEAFKRTDIDPAIINQKLRAAGVRIAVNVHDAAKKFAVVEVSLCAEGTCPQHGYIVAARSGHTDSALCRLLAAYIGEINVVRSKPLKPLMEAWR